MKNNIDDNLNLLWSTLSLNELINQGVKQFYIAPGMRNAPLIGALTSLQNLKPEIEINIEIVMDKRALAFRALGFAKVNTLPAVLICTSGTALANFLPAVIEAKKSNLPLIILTADRPPELINSDDNQTIEQTHFYRPWVNHDLNMGCPCEEVAPRALTTSVAQLYFKSLFPNPGPVHMNLMMREPLGFVESKVNPDYKNTCLKLIESQAISTQYEIPQLLLNPKALGQITEDINNAKKGLLVIGSLPNFIDKKIIVELINKLSFSFFIEVSSSLKYLFNLNDQQIPTFDHPEVQQKLKSDPPDFVLHLGGRLTSKFYYQFLSNNPELNLYVLNSTQDKEDPTHLVKKRFVIDLNTTLKQINQSVQKKDRNHYQFGIEDFSKNKIKFLEEADLSFPVISKTFIDTMPNNIQIILGNSTTIRTFDSYFSFETKKDFQIYTNRGVSGIEGFIATALGIIDATKKDVYLVLGDVSFIHDFNSLFMLTKNTKSFLKTILINNGGGAIFTLLPIKKDKEILDIITSPHSFEFSGVTHVNSNIAYRKIDTRANLIEGYKWLSETNSHAILEIVIDNQINTKVYDQLKTIR